MEKGGKKESRGLSIYLFIYLLFLLVQLFSFPFNRCCIKYK
jgi:hypothetical protein